MSKVTLFFYRLAYCLYKLHLPVIPQLINIVFVRILFGCQIGLGAKIGKNVNLGYGGLGCVIHSRAILGDNVRVGTNVTIGGTSQKVDVPIIGDNCILSTGCKVIGPIHIQNNCVIGANAVVISDIPSNSLCVGMPAKIIKSNISPLDY
ncbi:serine O-acetyltransferase [Bizionia sp.]|uniref:serine O-acetyltransferase n=1 Tax=Bizionia sp. TaxID=1954480 RepID=UPI003A8D5A0F